MTVRILGAFLAIVVLSGCTSMLTIEHNRRTAAYDEVNRAVRGKVARLVLHDGSRMDAVDVHVDAESLTWLDRRTNTLESIPTTDVREVSVVRAGAHAVRGLIAGLAAGAAVGGLRAAIEGDDPELGADPFALTRAEKLRIYPAAHAVYASLFTTPIGAVLSARRTYRFEAADVTLER